MNTYDFARRNWDYDDNESPSRNDVKTAMIQMSSYMKPSFDNDNSYIAGVRTSATIFTPTVSEAWTVDALIGKYLVAIVAGTKSTYTIHKIADNNATTVTISATAYGDAALIASADTIMIYDTLDDAFDDVAWVQI